MLTSSKVTANWLIIICYRSLVPSVTLNNREQTTTLLLSKFSSRLTLPVVTVRSWPIAASLDRPLPAKSGLISRDKADHLLCFEDP